MPSARRAATAPPSPGTCTEATSLAKHFLPGIMVPLRDNLGITTVGDLLDNLPRRYVEPGTLTDLRGLVAGEHVVIVAEVATVTSRRMKYRKGEVVTVVVTDGVGQVELTFFSAKATYKLKPGVRAFFAGRVEAFKDKVTLTHPTYEVLKDDDLAALDDYREHLIPIYGETGKLQSWQIAATVKWALGSLAPVPDFLPGAIRERHGLLGRDVAVRTVHRPRNHAEARAARARLRYDEAFVLQTVLAQRRHSAAEQRTTARHPRQGGLLAAFDATLPFELTAGQVEVGRVLVDELAKDRPMHRLLQGEVGSGKTVVALRAMLAVIDSGGQAALLAPTEVLAAQHHRSITAMLGDLAEGGLLGGAEQGTRVALLTGSQSAPARRQALNDAVTGDAGIVVGTHALIQDNVEFLDLALVVVDEQHRFGVEQRDALRVKGKVPPHVLVMTATPIPRTVAMTVFGDMETSTMRELPPGRSPVATHVVDAGRPPWVERTWARVGEEVAAGHQAYVVCPRIGDGAEDEPSELTSVLQTVEDLRGRPQLAGLRIEMLHGRREAEAKEATMRAFGRGEIDVLVSTTVIEVGVDVANATVMVVLDADRFGVSQLHQLRGRVGRGSAPGLCLLMTSVEEGPARGRLDAVAATNDGFELARVDLEQRREGDILGARQSGLRSSLRLLRILRDETLIADAREDAFALVEADPDLSAHPGLRDRVAAALDEEQAAYLERG